MVRVDTEYDTDPDNDYSDPVQVRLLTDRDITVGLATAPNPQFLLTGPQGQSCGPHRNTRMQSKSLAAFNLRLTA